MPDATSPEFCSVDEIARALGIADKTAHRWIDEGRLAAVRIGGRVLVPRSELGRLAAAAAANLRPVDVDAVPGATMDYRGGFNMSAGGGAGGARRQR